MRNLISLSIILLAVVQQSFATTYYVDAVKPNNNGGGTSWTTAKKDLQTALNLAVSGDSVLVAEGTYYPTEVINSTSTDPRDKSFFLDKDITLIGGYPSGGGLPNPDTKPTILSGDIGIFGDDTDNSYHVFITAGLTPAALIKGFVIMHGRADKISTVYFSGKDFSRSSGGGMFNRKSSPTINSVVIAHNYASSAGGLYNYEADVSFRNSVVCFNSANESGGIRTWGSTASFTNITVAFNSANREAGISLIYDTLVISNSVVYGNTATTTCSLDVCISFATILPGSKKNASDVNNGTLSNLPGFQHLNSNPFVGYPAGPDSIFMTLDDGLRPKFGSKLINNAGALLAQPDTVDITGIPRLINGYVDIGAYEYNCITYGGIFHKSCNASFMASTGKTVHTTGVYHDTLQNSQGCDSIIRLDVTVNPKVIYVDASRPDNSGSGYSWATAKKDLQNGLDLALTDTGCDTVKVAEGTYLPTEAPNGDTTIPELRCFHIDKDLVLLGGYPGGGGIRNTALNAAVLSGDIGTPNDSLDNCYHVLITANLTSASLIDGFTITKGQASGTEDVSYSNQIFSQAYGGGILNVYSTVRLSNISCERNFGIFGGGIYNFESELFLHNAVLAYNHASAYGGGIRNNGWSTSFLNNVLFINNRAGYSHGGGGMATAYSNSKLKNCTFVNNQGNYGGGAIYNDKSVVAFYNTVFYNNDQNHIYNSSGSTIDPASSNNASDITTGAIANTKSLVSLISDPFLDGSIPRGQDSLWMTPDDGLRPAPGSLLIDAGTLSAVDSSLSIDLSGLARVYNDSVDIGCYEYQCPLTQGNTITASNGTLTANTPNVSYQWVDCNAGFTVVAGATAQTFTPTNNGSYAVIVNNGTCRDTSACYAINDIGLSETQLLTDVHLYPNPTTGNVNLILPSNTTGLVEIKLFNSLGQVVDAFRIVNAETIELPLPGQKGVYFLKVKLKDRTIIKKVVKE